MNFHAYLGDAERNLRLEADLPFYCEELLRIRPKLGGLVPFKLNAAQMELHRRLEDQKAKTGKVRVIILKARQLGISTAVAAILLRWTLANPGWQTGVIAHERPAVKNLFDLVKRFVDNLPEEHRPEIGAAEALAFSKIDSGYTVSVATEAGSGRSSTLQLIHGSEVAFWPNLLEQLAALVQATPDVPGRQFGDQFHQLWRAAESGESEFMPIFLPWFIDPGYRTPAPEDFSASESERAYAAMHGLDDDQLNWRRNKIRQLLGSEDRFACEYPATPSEAFLASSFDSFITADLVMGARKVKDIEPNGDLLIGLDPAGRGADSTAVAYRRGSVIEKVERHRGLDTMQIAGMVTEIIRRDKPAQINIDVGGLGVGIHDRLVEQGHGATVHAINFGGKPVNPVPTDEAGNSVAGYANRRAEMWGNVKDALQGGRFRLPDQDDLMADLTSCGYSYQSNGALLLESKEAMRKRGMPSPDLGDAVALCFAAPHGSPIVNKPLRGFEKGFTINYPNSGIY